MKYQYKKLKCSQIISEVLQDLNLNISVSYYPDYQIMENLQTHGQIMFFSAIGDEAERKSSGQTHETNNFIVIIMFSS